MHTTTSRADLFEAGRHYVIIEAFTDFDRREHRVGDVIRFESRDYAPYDDGHMLHVTDPDGVASTIRLRDAPEDQQQLLRRLDQVFRRASARNAPIGQMRTGADLLARAREGAAAHVERTVALAWVMGLLPAFRGVPKAEAHRLCESLQHDEPVLGTRPRSDVEAQLAWCEALTEFREDGLDVWPTLEHTALAEHRAALRWALGEA